VFAVAGGRAELRRVQTGRTNGLETEILSGLGEGDMVVLHPGDRIRAGTRVASR
jgi:HlyD family secretion protein